MRNFYLEIKTETGIEVLHIGTSYNYFPFSLYVIPEKQLISCKNWENFMSGKNKKIVSNGKKIRKRELLKIIKKSWDLIKSS